MNLARWCTVVGVGGATAACGLWLRSLGLFSAAAAMVALRASAVPSGASPSLGALGLDLPPVTIVLTMPLAVVPILRWDPFAPVIVSALAGGLAAWWLFGSLRAMGLGVVGAVALVLAVVVHPAWLYAAASGSGTVLASALLVAALKLLRQWQRTGTALSVLVSAFAMAVAGLTRYELFAVGCGIAVWILLGPRARPDEPRDERPAFSIAYAAAVIGALGLWLVVNWSLSGDPLAFVERSYVAVEAPPSSQPPLHALVVMVPALIAAAAAAFLRRAPATALTTAIVCAAAVLTSIASGSPLSLDAVVPLVPLTALLIGEVVAGRAATAVALAAPALVATGALALLLSGDWGEAHRAVTDLVRGRTTVMWSGERELAAYVRTTGGTLLIDERVDAVAGLLVDPRQVVPIEGSARDASGRPGTELVLARTPTGRGAAHRVDAAWPTLYEGGVPWARRVATWPVSGEPAEYRLYAVSPVSGK